MLAAESASLRELMARMGHPTVRRPPIDPTRVEVIEVVANPTATHLRFRVPGPRTAHS